MKAFDLSLLKPEDFPESFRDVVEVLGVEATFKLCENFGGMPLYIPKSDNIRKRLRDIGIQKEYKNGATVEELCKKYNLTSPYIRCICQLSKIRQLTIQEFLDER